MFFTNKIIFRHIQKIRDTLKINFKSEILVILKSSAQYVDSQNKIIFLWLLPMSFVDFLFCVRPL